MNDQGVVGGWRAIGRFGLHLVSSRWFMFFASELIMATAGTIFLFGLYSQEIKSTLGYDQTTLNVLGFFKDLGSSIGIVAGLFCEIAPPWMVLSLGAAMNFGGYFMIWLAVTQRIVKPPVWQLSLYICIGANSLTFVNTVLLVTCVVNFPESRGVVLGLLKGFTGLTGALFTQLYHAIYGDNSKSLILLIAWLPAAVSFIFLGTIRTMRRTIQANELKIFYNFLFISLTLAGFLMIIIILQNRHTFTATGYAGTSALELILLFLPLLVVIKEELILWQRKREVFNVATERPQWVESPLVLQPGQSETPPESTDDAPPNQKEQVSCFGNLFSPPERGEDYTILQALFSIDMLIIFTTTSVGVGGALTAIDNLGQIGKALGYPKNSISIFISLVSIWNFLGRVSAGFVSEFLLAKYKFPRPLVLTLVLLVSCIAHLLIALGVPNSLYAATVILGFCFGAQWPLIFAIISELFGLRYYSTLINVGIGASPLGNYILNVRLAGHLYDKEGLRQLAAKGLARKEGEDLTCIGVECYRLSFLVITAAALFGCIVSAILVFRTRNFYKGDIYKKYKEQAKVVELEITTDHHDADHQQAPHRPQPPVR